MKYKQTEKSLKLKPVCLKLKLLILLNNTKIVFAIHRKKYTVSCFPQLNTNVLVVLQLYF